MGQFAREKLDLFNVANTLSAPKMGASPILSQDCPKIQQTNLCCQINKILKENKKKSKNPLKFS